MSSHEFLWVLGGIGSILMLALSINAFFLKEIIMGLNDLRVKLAEITVEVKNYDHRLLVVERNVERIERAQLECPSRNLRNP